MLRLYGFAIVHTCEKCCEASTDFCEKEGSLSFFRMSRVLEPEVSSKRAFGNPKVEAVNPSHFRGGNAVEEVIVEEE
jgi:hypothetical protein